MVYLGGPRGRHRPVTGRGIYLHDPPPGYHPPRPHVPAKNQRRFLRRESILLRVLTIVLILTVAAVVAMIGLAIATYS
jgi:hypothetical protein